MGADKIVVKEWLDKAEEDFCFASACLNDPQTSYFNIICFHYQQATEKYLKTYVVAEGLKFEKIHNLKRLLEICQENEPKFRELAEDCLYLNTFYIEPRYPVDVPVTVDKAVTFKAKEAAQKIRDFVLKKLEK